jgi:hypothetical protein
MLSMVEGGLGVAVVPLMETILPLPPSVRAIPLGPDPIHREIGAVQQGQTLECRGRLY